jgi:pilus assembly protein CpaB
MQTAQRPPTNGHKTKKQTKPGSSDLSKLLSTRGGLVAIALVAALMAAALLTIFLQNYKKSVSDESMHTVLVAKTVIPKGADGDVLAEQDMFQTSRIQGTEVKDGALTDPAAMRDKVTSTTVYPGEQITAEDFAASSDNVNTKVAADQRAISIPVDASHGMLGNVSAGDHVDVYGSFYASKNGSSAVASTRPIVRVLLRDAVVLTTPPAPKGPSASGPNSTQPVVLKVPGDASPQLAYAVDNGLVWIVQRPQAGARDSQLDTVTIQRILGARPIGGAR